MRPEEERELIAYLENVIASHPLKQPGLEPVQPGRRSEPGPASFPWPTLRPRREGRATPEPTPEDAPDLGERGAGLRLLWGAAPGPAAEVKPGGDDPASESVPPFETLPEAQTLYDRLERPPADAMDQLQAAGISRATVARTGVRWTGQAGGYARHLVFPLKVGGLVRQLQFWPMDSTDQPVDQLSLIADRFGPPDGLFGVMPPAGEPVFVTETPLDALSLNEQGFFAVAGFQGLPPSRATAGELRDRSVYLVSADDVTGEAWREAWHARLEETGARWVDVVLPVDVDGTPVQGPHDLLLALPLGFAFADAMRTLIAAAETAAQEVRQGATADTASESPPESPPEQAGRNWNDFTGDVPFAGHDQAAVAASGSAAAAEESASPEAALLETERTGSREGATSPQAGLLDRMLEPGAAATEAAADAEGEAGHTAFYLSFLEEREAVPDQLAPSGLAELDEHLAGGFDRGLYLLAGEPGAGKTAFLEDLAIDAATKGRPVVLYALKEGSRATWERMIARLSRIMGERPLSLPDVRGGRLDESGMDILAELDRVFRVAVLPRLTLLDGVPGGPDPLLSFLTDLRRRVDELSSAFRRTPLVLLDDLQYLLLALNAEDRARASHLVMGMNDLLSAARCPALLTSAWPTGWAGAGIDEPPETQPDHLAEGLLVLRFRGTRGEETVSRLSLDILKNGRTGWVGTIDLALDRTSGLLWSEGEGEAAPEDAPPV